MDLSKKSSLCEAGDSPTEQTDVLDLSYKPSSSFPLSLVQPQHQPLALTVRSTISRHIDDVEELSEKEVFRMAEPADDNCVSEPLLEAMINRSERQDSDPKDSTDEATNPGDNSCVAWSVDTPLDDSLDASSPATSLTTSVPADPPVDSAPSQSSVRKSRSEANSLSRVSSRIVIAPTVSLKDTFEYFWPAADVDVDQVGWKDKEPDWFMIQEVISEILQVKSFKRKYPDLARRPVDGWEKAWLVSKDLVPSSLADLGLTAVRSEEIMTLLETDYPDMYADIATLLQGRRIQQLRDRQKEQYQTSRVERGGRLEQSRQKAVKSASEFNRRITRERKTERRYYWDLETMQIHVTKSPQDVRPAVFNTDLPNNGKGSYPVALIPGQFVEKFRSYTAEELRYMPLERALYLPPEQSALFQQEVMQNAPVDTMITSTTVTPSRPPTSFSSPSVAPSAPTTAPTTPAPSMPPFLIDETSNASSATQQMAGNTLNDSVAADVPEQCCVCLDDVVDPLQCTDCPRKGHPRCLELPPNMVTIVRTYPWSCMLCKKCVVCLDPGNEDQMMFCDRCDRGYHAFCVDLSAIPEGNWECPSCLPDAPEDHLPLAKVRKTVKGRERRPQDTRRLFHSLA